MKNTVAMPNLRAANKTTAAAAVDPRLAHQQSSTWQGTNWRTQFRDDVLKGLRAAPRHLSSLYFYDDRGSELFDEITRLPEYYLTRTEQAILRGHAHDIAGLVDGSPVCVVDLGAGSGEKTRCLIAAMLDGAADVVYAPLDVSSAALEFAGAVMRKQFPSLGIDAVRGEYVPGLARIRTAQKGRQLLVLWLGSSIGNLTDVDAAKLLGDLAAECAPGDLFLIGFDLLKDPRRLVAAYDDRRGVTAEFNFNLLRRINRELQGNFDIDAFAHHAVFSPQHARMESYLLSRKRQTVSVAGHEFEFQAWEPIHTEISSKYSPERIAELLRRAGLVELASYRDGARDFVDVVCVRREPLAMRSAT